MPIESSADKAYMHDLPKVSFRIITDDKSLTVPAGVQSEQSRSYGYNDFSDFERPDYYIRYIEPIESELAKQVEYDMDEQDQEWLDAINAERKKEQSGTISYEAFEIIMDKLEKEWFTLSKRIPQPVQHQTAEDTKCVVCDDGEGENSNAIVFCDGCNLAVHQDCYGVPYIPEGQWLCRKCTVSPENPVSCIFCPNEGGAFKQTTSGHWAHLLCSIWIPETGLGNAIYMEPVEGVENIPKSRWKLVCSLCRERTGACVQCDNRNCFTAFHVTCARQVGLLQSMKSLSTDGLLKAFCTKHLPAATTEDESDTASNFSSYDEVAPTHHSHTKNKARRASGPIIIPVTKKSAQAHSKSFKPGPPIVPKLIVDKLEEYVAKIGIRKRNLFVERLCRYWSLKREARRGAPLLKRLHLEPWTASAESRQQTEAEKAQKLKFLQLLRNDLEKVRMLAELVRKREKEKLRQVQVIKDVVDDFIFPHHGKLRVVLEKISAMDRQEMFLNPVNRAEVPDYYDVIKEPMCWSFIDEKLEKNGYLNVADFKRDALLTLDNAMIYNSKETPFHRAAARIKKNALPILDELSSVESSAAKKDQPSPPPELPVGDLEPSTSTLAALLHRVSGPNDPEQDILSSIFSFELEKPREPTPPPRPKAPRKSISAAEKKQRWEEREAAARERALNRLTRSTKAAEKAFAHEAGIQPSSDAEATPRPEDTGGDGDGDARSRRRSMRTAVLDAGPSTRTPKQDKPTPKPKPKTVKVESQQHPASEGAAASGSGSSSPTKTSTSTLHHPSRPQRGVVGVEAIPILSDRERRERERQLDIMTEEIGASDQFTRFNVGWVLPEGTKRRRAERPAELSRSTSHRDQSSSSSRKPTSTTSKARISLSPIKALADRNGNGSESELSSPPPSSAMNSAFPTPVGTRTSKRKAPAVQDVTPRSSKRARTEKGKYKSPEAGDDEPRDGGVGGEGEDVGDVEGMEVDEANEDVGGEQEDKLDDENDDDVDVKGEGGATDDPTIVEGEKAKVAADVEEVDRFPPGTLVWAKVHSYPYFPAEIIDPAEDELPSEVLSREPAERKAAQARGKRVWLVRFFDATNSYGWVAQGRLDELGEDEAIDAMYLAGKERGRSKGFKNRSYGQQVKKGYREALASTHSAEEDGEGAE